MIQFDASSIKDGSELEDSAPIPSGFHRAKVRAVHQDQKTGAMKVIWEILSPPWAGSTLTETHNLPGLCREQAKIPGMIRKLGLFLYRMGLMKKEQMGKPFPFDEQDLVGIERVLEVERKVAKDKPADSRQYSNVVYGAYWADDRPEIPGHERARLGMALLTGQSAEEPPPKPTASARPNGHTGSPAPKILPFDPAEV